MSLSVGAHQLGLKNKKNENGEGLEHRRDRNKKVYAIVE